MQTVLHIANFKASYSSNFLASIRSLNRCSHDIGWRHAVAVPEGARSREWVELLRGDGIPVHHLPGPEAIYHATKAIASIARTERAAILHTHFSRQYEVEAAAARLLNLSSTTKLIWHRHSSGLRLRPFSTRMKDFVGNRLLAPDAVVLAVSAELADAASESGVAASNVKVIGNGIDVKRATGVSAGRSAVRSSWQVDPGQFTFLHFGWDPITKGVDIVVRAGERAVALGGNFALVLVGRERTLETVRSIVGSHCPKWLRLVEPRECVADLYSAADCFLSSSRWEGFSYAVAEAMAFGLPVISTDLPGLNWVAQSKGVLRVPVDHHMLASAMMSVLDSCENERRLWSEANRQLIIQNYSVERWVDEMIQVYIDILRRPPLGVSD